MAKKSPFHQLAEWAAASPNGARDIRMETQGSTVRLVACTWVLEKGKEPEQRMDFVVNAFAFVRVDGNLVSALQRAASRCLGQLSGKIDPTVNR
jgi:hypothetical protein